MKKYILSLLAVLTATLGFAQGGLEGIIVEEVDASSVMENGIAYRVYVDLEDGFKLQSLIQSDESPFEVNTTGTWFNSLAGSTFGNTNNVPALLVAFPDIEFDSYVSLGAASSTEFGLPIADDTTDGTADGRMIFEGSSVPTVSPVGTPDLESSFGNMNSMMNFSMGSGNSLLTTQDNGDITPGNKIFIGQFTTDGEFSFSINLLTVVVGGSQQAMLYANDIGSLNYPDIVIDVVGCMDADACNYNAEANVDSGDCTMAEGCDTCSGETDGTGTVVDNPDEGESCDDGDETTTNDVIQEDCSCQGDPVGIEDFSNDITNVVAYPNPAQDFIAVNFYLQEGGLTTIDIIDVSGRIISSDSQTLNSGDVTHSMNTEFLTAGTYLLRLSHGAGEVVKRFSVVR